MLVFFEPAPYLEQEPIGSMTQRAVNQSKSPETKTLSGSNQQNAEAQLSSVELDGLYREHTPALTAYLRRQFGDGPPDPEDIAHQAFEKLVRRQRSERIDNYPAFLRQTAKNLAISALRHMKVRSNHELEVERRFFPEEGDESSPERVIEVREQLSIINAALRAMPEIRREAFILNRIDGVSKSEVARRQGISRTAVVKRLAQAAAEINAALAAGVKTKP